MRLGVSNNTLKLTNRGGVGALRAPPSLSRAIKWRFAAQRSVMRTSLAPRLNLWREP